MYYNELLSSYPNKLKTSWNIIYNEIGTASSRQFSQTEFKLRNKNINTNKPAKISNNYVRNSVDDTLTLTGEYDYANDFEVMLRALNELAKTRV